VTTRRIHVVRVKDPNNESQFADVVVIDAIALRAANGEEQLWDVTARKAVPYIVDNTGDGETIGNLATASRVSHMKRLTNPDDSGQFIDVEILDAFALRGPNGEERVYSLPDRAASEAVTDNTGSGLGVAAGPSTTRALHVAKISETGAGKSTNTDYPPVDSDTTDRYALVKRIDAIVFRGPNGFETAAVFPDQGADALDVTQYTVDDNGDQVPPDNTDPNVYVRWPKDTAGPWLGKQPIGQGPLWFIKALSGNAAILVLSFQGFNNAATGFGFLTSCALVTPDGTSYPLFSDIHSIGVGNSANLALPADAVFTADPVYSFGPIAQHQAPGIGPFNNYFSYQTIFVNLAKFTSKTISGTSDQALRFKLTLPAQPMSVNAVAWQVAWDLFGAANLLGPPTNYESTVDGVTIFNQSAALAAIAGHSPTLMCAQVFETPADAAAFAALHNLTGDYYLTEMFIDAIALGGNFGVHIQTFDNTKKDADHPHGPYQFPISVPVLNSSDPPSPTWPSNTPHTAAGEDWNFVPWPIGFESSAFPGATWPTDRNFDLSVSASETVTADNPAKTLWFDVITTADPTTKDGKFRVRWYNTTEPAPLI
jgi:hypothetical protein